MPLLTIASACCRISVSLMLQPNVFQEFQPMGGVRATPLSRACAAVPGRLAPTDARSRPAARAVTQRCRRRRWFIASPWSMRLTGGGADPARLDDGLVACVTGGSLRTVA